jgi:hypothetical protein
MKHLKLFEDYNNIPNYQKIFISKLKEKFPDEVKLYHITYNEYVDDILKNGLRYNVSKYRVIHTVLGKYDYDRVSGYPEGLSVIEITMKPDEYYDLYPEENTYWCDDMDDAVDGDERDEYLFRNYLESHPDLIGGDITLYDNIPPDKLKVVSKDGIDLE